MASDDILKLDCNGSNGGLGKLSYRKSSSGGEDISDVGREEYQPATSRGTDGFDQERNVTLSPFFWLKEQDDNDETDGQDRDQQLEMDHVTDTPTYAMPAFSDLKDSEDGSPEKGTEQPSSVEKEQRDAPDHVRNQICEQELYATEKGRLNFEFTQSVNTADSGSGLLTRSQKSSTSKTKCRRVGGCTKTTKKGSVNGNGDATLIMGGGPDQLIDEKEGNEHLLGHAHIHHEIVVNLDPKAHGNMEPNNVHHLEDVNGETLDPAKKANKKVRKPNKKNTQAYIVGEDNTKTRIHGSNDIRSDERLDDIPRKFAVEKLSCDPSESLEEIRDSVKDQMCKRENGKMDELLPAIDLPNPEKNEINAFKGNTSGSNVKHCTRKKWKRWQVSRTQTCTVSVRENNPGHSPTERICESLLGTTEPPDNRKGQISGVDAHTVDEEGDHQCSRQETRSRTSNSSSIINQINSCKRKKRKGSDVSTVCSDLVPVLEEIFDGSNKVVRVPIISGSSRCLQDKDANSPAKAVEVCGEMLHFANGRIASSDYNGGSAVVHAHRNCVRMVI
ncbi:hypothetical protein EJ110_NYTH54049 [Nymphaea thermarum]|nr:hypothetical protein EJ110_NYTH54049 [Nymphaea thermarum]